MSSTISSSKPAEAKNNNKKTTGWRWFIGMYFVSIIILGSFHGLSHFFTGWLNSF